MKVLLALEQEKMTGRLKQVLEQNRFLVDWVHTGEEVLEAGLDPQYDVLVLDMGMPGMNGMEALKYIRDYKNTTPILLMDRKTKIEHLVSGLEAGADDYLAPPFFTQEFVVRVKALCRRRSNYTEEIQQFGNLRLSSNCKELICGADRLRLNNKEYQLAELFIQHPHCVFSKEYLLEYIWGREGESSVDVVWTHMGFLRKKMRNLGADVEIRTKRGVGYFLEKIQDRKV